LIALQDEHRIPLEELVARLGSNLETVKMCHFFFCRLLNMLFHVSLASFLKTVCTYSLKLRYVLTESAGWGKFGMKNTEHKNVGLLTVLKICSD